jgi:hypothetical protein
MITMDIISWLNEAAHVNRHVNPLYFIIVILITSSILIYSIKTNNKRAVRIFIYGFIVWLALEIGLFATGIRHYSLENPYLVIFLVGGVEDPGWVCLAYLAAEKMMQMHRAEIIKK